MPLIVDISSIVRDLAAVVRDVFALQHKMNNAAFVNGGDASPAAVRDGIALLVGIFFGSTAQGAAYPRRQRPIAHAAPRLHFPTAAPSANAEQRAVHPPAGNLIIFFSI